MNAQEFSDAVTEIIEYIVTGDPDEFSRIIQEKDWDTLKDTIYYTACEMNEDGKQGG